ncbi:hypothetical protein ACHAP5_009569 [Fusarium lateritium]
MATCLVAGSNASPCKVSSRTTEATTTAGVPTTVASTETATAETTIATEEASTTAEDVTTTALSSIALSSTEQLSVTVTVSESSIETTLATTTIVSSSQDSSVPDPTSTEAESAVTSNESVATTTDGTATAAPTTTEAATTTTEAAAPTFILNAGFEDSSESVSPWSLYTFDVLTSLTVDTTVSHDGQNSAHIYYGPRRSNAIQQEIQGPIMPNVEYKVSAWVRASSGCSRVSLGCKYQYDETAGEASFSLDPASAGEWRQISSACSYTQEEFDFGGFVLTVGFECDLGSDAYVDTVSFTL